MPLILPMRPDVDARIEEEPPKRTPQIRPQIKMDGCFRLPLEFVTHSLNFLKKYKVLCGSQFRKATRRMPDISSYQRRCDERSTAWATFTLHLIVDIGDGSAIGEEGISHRFEVATNYSGFKIRLGCRD